MSEYGKIGNIKSMYTRLDADRRVGLDRCRLCASLTLPWVLPPENMPKDGKVAENFQSVGSRGVVTLVGRIIAALFPPDQPWFQLELAPDIEHDPEASPEKIQAIKDKLFIREIIIQSALESTHLEMSTNIRERRSGFRSNKMTSLTQLIVTGDTLEHLTDELRLKVYRRDQYVTVRDSSGDILQHIICEKIDPLSLTDEQFTKSKLIRSEVEKKSACERMCDIFTNVEWDPQAKKWKIEQEVNGETIATATESISPFFCTAAYLSPGESYGRGFIEMNLGELRTMDELELRLLQFAEMASRLLLGIDKNSDVEDEDLTKPTGSLVRNLVVSAGQIQDVGFLRVDKISDFNVVYQTAERKRRDLGKAMLMEDAAAPTGESGRSPVAWQTIVAQLQGALGGMYAPIADEQQIPLLRRVIHVLEKKNMIVSLGDSVKVTLLTGLAALVKEAKFNKFLTFLNVIGQMGEEAKARLDPAVITQVLARYNGMAEPGILKSDERMAEERQQVLAEQTQAMAAQQAVKTVGNIAETQAATPVAA